MRLIALIIVVTALAVEPDYDEQLAAAEAEHEAVKNGPDIAARLTIFGSSDYSFI